MYPRKRWMCTAVNGTVSAPQPVRDARSLLSEFAGAGPAVVGFDFPIGLPAAYCEKRQIGHFLSALDLDWEVTNSPSLEQPFFPHTPGYKMEVLERALGLPRREGCASATGSPRPSPVLDDRPEAGGEGGHQRLAGSAPAPAARLEDLAVRTSGAGREMDRRDLPRPRISIGGFGP